MTERCKDKEHYLCPGYPLCDGGVVIQGEGKCMAEGVVQQSDSDTAEDYLKYQTKEVYIIGERVHTSI